MTAEANCVSLYNESLTWKPSMLTSSLALKRKRTNSSNSSLRLRSRLPIGEKNIMCSRTRQRAGSTGRTRGYLLCSAYRRLHAEQEQRTLKIREQLLRTERELHGILQKKFDIIEFARRDERDRIRSGHLVASSFSAPSQALSLPPAHGKLSYLTQSECVLSGSHFMNHHNPTSARPQDVRCGRAVLALAEFFRIDLDLGGTSRRN
mmetsp:Transcript_34030/g.102738  ORF Transcript_34030/g.102738 Transcript_34030/m.102738 type:complete len:206 (+) Transcript_34030:218-835(+)